MIDEGENVIVDYCKRSVEEQLRMFQNRLSKCDGTIKISKHQRGMAVDLYFVVAGELLPPFKGWKYWHDKWEETGGSPMIEFDKGHFE